MKTRILLLALLTALLPVIGIAGSAEAATAPRYKNCRTVHKAGYWHGVAKSKKAARKQYAAGWEKAKVSRAIYAVNKRLDRDGDNVICEERRFVTPPLPPLLPIVVNVSLRLDAITYSDWQGMDVTYLRTSGGVCPSASGDGFPFCDSALTDSAGTVTPTSSNPGNGLASAPALAPGASYKLTVTEGTKAGYWSCSIYNPDGCSWRNPSSRTWTWTFTYQNIDNQVVPSATVVYN